MSKPILDFKSLQNQHLLVSGPCWVNMQKIGQLPQAKPILVALKDNFSNYGEVLKPCATLASGALGIDGEWI